MNKNKLLAKLKGYGFRDMEAHSIAYQMEEEQLARLLDFLDTKVLNHIQRLRADGYTRLRSSVIYGNAVLLFRTILVIERLEKELVDVDNLKDVLDILSKLEVAKEQRIEEHDNVFNHREYTEPSGEGKRLELFNTWNLNRYLSEAIEDGTAFRDVLKMVALSVEAVKKEENETPVLTVLIHNDVKDSEFMSSLIRRDIEEVELNLPY